MDSTSLTLIIVTFLIVAVLIVIVVLVPVPTGTPPSPPPSGPPYPPYPPGPGPSPPRPPPNPTCNSSSAAAISSFINGLPTSSRTAFCTALQQGIPTSCSSWQIQMMDSLASHNTIFSWVNGRFYPINMLQNQCSLTGSSTMTFTIIDDRNRTTRTTLTVS